VSFGDLL